MDSLDTILKAASGLGGGGFLAGIIILYKTGLLSKLNGNDVSEKLDTFHQENTQRFDKIDNCLSNIKDKVGKHEVEIAVIKALQNDR